MAIMLEMNRYVLFLLNGAKLHLFSDNDRGKCVLCDNKM